MYITHGNLYDSHMTAMSISEARERLADVIDGVKNEPVVLERYGKPAAVLVSPEYYEALLDAMEESTDVAAFDAALAESNPNIPWDQVKVDLGWT
jgi:antitoxin Phd